MSERRDFALRAAFSAGVAMLACQRGGYSVEKNTDVSPLTLADRSADQAITQVIEGSGVLVFSEEGNGLLTDAHASWLVDPLVGTKGFIAKNVEVHRNILFFEGVQPRSGVVYSPEIDLFFYGGVWFCAWRM